MLNRSGYFQDKQLYGSFRTKLSQDLSFITEGLKASVALSMDSRTISSIRRTITFAYYEKDATNENVLRRTREDDSMINKVDNTSSFRRTGIVAQLDYNRTFGKHGVSALAFYEQYESNDEMVLPTRFQSVNGWFGYNYDKKYGIDVIGAYQGSHKFGPGHKFGFFPTISAGWTVSNESFWKDAKKIVPYLKLKASYGQVGNSSGVDAFYYRGRMWPQNEVYITGVNMGTKLGFITTDAAIDKALLLELQRELIEDTFNMVSVDGDTSTNDTVFVFANGMAENKEITEKDADYEAFREGLLYVNQSLAKQIAGDGEGCTRLFEVHVAGADSKENAKILSKSVVTSSLTKAAIYGKDANWGRILCALGYAGVDFDPVKADISLKSADGAIEIVKDGIATDYSEDEATKVLSADAVTADIDVHNGVFEATAWGCDLTHDYVTINADYRS